MIKIVLLELPEGITKQEQITKFIEEVTEFISAVNYKCNACKIEEFYDVVQVGLGLLDIEGISIQDIQYGLKLHNNKLLGREWKFKENIHI
jgi:phosphoribosyl-ATP pyrophosphohydrolase